MKRQGCEPKTLLRRRRTRAHGKTARFSKELPSLLSWKSKSGLCIPTRSNNKIEEIYGHRRKMAWSEIKQKQMRKKQPGKSGAAPAILQTHSGGSRYSLSRDTGSVAKRFIQTRKKVRPRKWSKSADDLRLQETWNSLEEREVHHPCSTEAGCPCQPVKT